MRNLIFLQTKFKIDVVMRGYGVVILFVCWDINYYMFLWLNEKKIKKIVNI